MSSGKALSYPLEFKSCVVFLIIIYCYCVDAEELGESKKNYHATYSLYLDNDAFLSDEDRDYTGGGAFSVSSSDPKNHPITIDKLLTWVNRQLNLEEEDANLQTPVYSCEFGLNAFTPNEIGLKESIPNDRPYANLVYLANGQQSLVPSKNTAWVSSLTIGILGTDLAADLQNSIHRTIGSTVAEGWSNQISDGGEPTFKYELTKIKFYPTTKYTQFTTSYTLSIGFITEVSAGFGLKLGRLNSQWWTSSADLNRLGSKVNPYVMTGSEEEHRNDSYFIIGSQVKLRGYNVFLQGQFRDSAVKYSLDEIRPLIYEGWFGYTQELFNNLKLSYIYRYQTSELKVGLADREFSWGGILVALSY